MSKTDPAGGPPCAVLALIAAAAVAVTGCGAGAGDKAGGPPRGDRVTLTLANPSATPEELEAFAATVKRLSRGSVRVAFRNGWRARTPSEPAMTKATIRDVQQGRVDLAAIPTRSFDSVGVHALDALDAPLLVDSYPLEQRVLAGPLPARMLAGVTSLHVVGLGILPGPLRKPLGVSRLTRPADYVGRTIAISDSQVARQTLQALGAATRIIARGAPISGTDGVEQQVASVEGNAYDRAAGYLTANVNLWPRPNVIITSPRVLARLSSGQRAAVRSAAAVAVGAGIAQQRRAERDSVAILCRRGLTFVTATPGDLRALHSATAPVIAQLSDADPTTRAAITTIAGIKNEQPAAPDAPSCGRVGSRPGAGARTAVDGTYRVHTTAADLRKAGAAEDEIIPDNYGDTTMVLKAGRFTQRQPLGTAEGTYTVKGDLFVMTVAGAGGGAAKNRPGEQFTFRWSLYRDQLTFRAVPGKVSPTGMLAKPWRRVR